MGSMSILTLWIIFGLINLVIASYLEVKNNQARITNIGYLMYGYTITLYSHFSRSVFYYLVLIIGILLLNLILSRFFTYINWGYMSWIFFGFGIYSMKILFFFLITFFITIYLYNKLHKIFKLSKPMPFNIMLLFLFFGFAQSFGFLF